MRIPIDCIQVLKFIAGLQSDYRKIKEKSEKLKEYQNVLKLNVDDFEIVDEVNADLGLKSRLWTERAGNSDNLISQCNSNLSQFNPKL